MHIQVLDAARLKATAKHLERVVPHLQHAAALDAVARSLRYRDFFEFTAHPDAVAANAVDADPATAFGVIVRLVAELEAPPGDVLFALGKGRLLSNTAWPLDTHLALRAALFRETVFKDARHGGPGTVVLDRVQGRPVRKRAYLQALGRPTVMVFDTGPGHRGDREYTIPRTPLPDFVPERLWRPYGVWALKDGSAVAFSRDYLPIWRVTPAGVERVQPWHWIHGIAEEMRFFDATPDTDWTGPRAVARADAWLAQHRIRELPRLVEVFPHFFEPDVQRFEDALQRFHSAEPERPLPSYASPYRSPLWG